jgi:SagB-type dehydrogenase family enzyme
MALVYQCPDFGDIIHLPPANIKGEMSLEESLAKRRSIRELTSKPLSLEQIGQLLWAAQGISDKDKGLRAAPSAGALYPLEVYVVLPTGTYHYNPGRHELKRVMAGDRRFVLQKAARDQEVIGLAPAVFVFAGVYERTAEKYGDRASRYVSIEAGHACQNLLLQATVQDLASVPVGAFDDRQVAEAIKLADNESPLYLAPVGYPGE